MFAHVARSLLAPVTRLVYRPVVEGRGNVPRRGPVILASNHLSFIDSMVIPLVAPRPVVFLAKAEYFTGTGFKGWLSRSFFTAIDAVPVERGTHRAAQASLDAALEVLNQGKAFGIYPEGKRSLDGRIYRGRTGVAWLALTSGAVVVPVALAGTEAIQPVGARFPRIRRVSVRFGEPLDFSDRAAAVRERRTPVGPVRRAVTDEIMDAIQALSQQDRAPAYNEGQRMAA
ncbi:1-acyl-sn-glycerol-3-phosphate acyltransferase [Streptacidiphilus sp. PB12-B1b]|uniref:lysophospholipid acyltransferase family protein n=1 Tax=Streptacidiphilus sp. PB12-B1b TaxID=2705012 RepID=UPI0015F9C9DF|nr:lysophospholipid acyltransferase family protein [Streptacidiphilus sp. PB12-B1b]QMU79557.1 1-acyl-sn-glycerol-3-phosphate acyltransferase [Streptacidiphilus sp. PB12-B1b]